MQKCVRSVGSSCLQFILLLWVCGISDAQISHAQSNQAPSQREQPAQREVLSLTEGWSLRIDGVEHRVQPGASWESQGLADFDGSGRFTTKISRDQLRTLEKADQSAAESSSRWILEIDGAATRAKVFADQEFLGEHLGAWTPFRFDITKYVRSGSPSIEIDIELDELVGHNTQGFLPIVLPHFGGIWKSVRILRTSAEFYIDDSTLLHCGFNGEDSLNVQAEVRGDRAAVSRPLEMGVRIVGPDAEVRCDWNWVAVDSDPQNLTERIDAAGNDRRWGRAEIELRPPVVRRWSPESPFLYEVEIALRDKASQQILDQIFRKAAIRSFTTSGRRLLINGQPVNVRGVLNWGYAPPRWAPATDEASMRAELVFAKQRGFNLMKFCLWLPPQRYLELADEMGMLTWIEYPTWHPDFSPAKYPELRKEFAEFFCYDRNTASAILRSLTCETGHGATEEVVRGLYQLGHEYIPGAIIEDDSSWIGWHRVHDFYDDHPYGNNQDWLSKLNELDEHIKAREPKPLILGEAIAADTWEPLVRSGRQPLPAHQSLSADRYSEYLQQVLKLHGNVTVEDLVHDSYDCALSMRKYQVEAFRWRLPDAGYVVSVIRDFPKAAMGLVDRWGQAKWTTEDFAWQRPTQLVLNQASTQRSFLSGVSRQFQVDAVGEGALPDELKLKMYWRLEGEPELILAPQRIKRSGSRKDQVSFRQVVELPLVERPTEVRLRCELSGVQGQISQNQWRLWLVPKPALSEDLVLYSDEADLPDSLGLPDHSYQGTLSDALDQGAEILRAQNAVLLVRRLSHDVLQLIEAGVGCVLLVDGGPGSFPLTSHWFLRGGPIVSQHSLTQRLNRRMLVDLQTMDLADSVLLEFPLLDEGEPLLSLWDNHDLDEYRTHSLLWEAKIGKGNLVCSALNYGDNAGAAGNWIVSELLNYVAKSPHTTAMSQASLQRLKRELRTRQYSLSSVDWSFRPALESDLADPEKPKLNWLNEALSQGDWQAIKTTSHWDGQGFSDLDGWGFYRCQVTIPTSWEDSELYLNFTGVDDYFEVFVDGVRLGEGGNIERKETAFELRKSFSIPEHVREDGELEIGVQVYDWYGAGGIFRPIYLSTEPRKGDRVWINPEL